MRILLDWLAWLTLLPVPVALGLLLVGGFTENEKLLIGLFLILGLAPAGLSFLLLAGVPARIKYRDVRRRVLHDMQIHDARKGTPTQTDAPGQRTPDREAVKQDGPLWQRLR